MATSHKDKGYAWVICAASFMAHVLHCNLLYSRGMFFIIFKKNMEGDSAAISLVPSINSALTFGFAPVAGLLVSKLGARKVGILGGTVLSIGLILASLATHVQHLYLTYGILSGIGIALIYNPCISVLPEYFNKRFGLATGIALSGCGFGFVVFQYVIKFLDDEYGWRGTLLICGAIELNLIVCAALYAPVQMQKNNMMTELKPAQDTVDDQEEVLMTMTPMEKEKAIEISNSASLNKGYKSSTPLKYKIFKEFAECMQLVKNPVYIVFSLGQMFNVAADSIIFTHAGAHAISLGYTKGDAAFLFTILGVVNTLTRMLTGVAAQRVHSLWLCAFSAFLLAGITFLLPFLTSLPLLIMYAALFGGLVAPYQTVPVVVTAEVVDPDMLSRAIGFQILTLAPSSLLGPLLAGVLYDRTGIYLTSFYMASGFLCLSGLSALLAMALRKFCLAKGHETIDVNATNETDIDAK